MPIYKDGAKCEKCGRFVKKEYAGMYECWECNLVLCEHCRNEGYYRSDECPDCRPVKSLHRVSSYHRPYEKNYKDYCYMQ